MKTFLSLGLIILLALTFSSFVSPNARNQKELFDGEKAFTFCRLYLPLDNIDNSKPYLIKVQRKNQGKPIVLIRYDEKTKTGEYFHYYLISNQIATGIYEYYLQTPEDFAGNSVVAVKYKYDAQNDRFYTGGCFDENLKQHPEFGIILTEGKYPTKKIRIS